MSSNTYLDQNHIIEIEEVQAILSLLELVDIEQLDPSRHQAAIRLCLRKLNKITSMTLGS